MRHDPGTIRRNSQFENMVIFRIPQMRSPKKVDFAVSLTRQVFLRPTVGLTREERELEVPERPDHGAGHRSGVGRSHSREEVPTNRDGAKRIDELVQYIKGWWSYFCHTESVNRLRPLAHWVRRRLRALLQELHSKTS